MKILTFISLISLLLAVLGSAQNSNITLPNCAVECVSRNVQQSSCPPPYDSTCLCQDTIFQDLVAKCIGSDCSVIDGLTARNATSLTCHWPSRNEQDSMRKVAIPFFVIASIFFFTRIAARIPCWGGTFGPDDYTISLAYLCTLIFTALLFLLVGPGGLGRDVWTLSAQEVTRTLQYFTGFEKTYILCVWFTKISILLVYLRLFPDETFRTTVKLCLSFCVAAVFCLFWACVFKCWPISYSWTFWDGEHHGSCSSMSAQGWANAGLSIFADFVILLLPLHTVYKLHLTAYKKAGAMMMFSVGVFITGVSLYRLNTMKYFSFSDNPTHDFFELSMWSAIEVYVSIICACMPGCRNFVTRVVLGKLLGKKSDSMENRPGSAATSTRPLTEKRHPSDSWLSMSDENSDISRQSSVRDQGGKIMHTTTFHIVETKV